MMNAKEREKWIAQATDSMDYAVRSAPHASLREWERIAKKAETLGFPSWKAARRSGIVHETDHQSKTISYSKMAPGTTKTVQTVLESGKPIRVTQGLCDINDCPTCFYESLCPREETQNVDALHYVKCDSDINSEEQKVWVDHWTRRANKILGRTDSSKKPLGTVGIYNPTTKKWEGGMPEEEAKKSSPQSTIGVYHPENKTWVGGGSKPDQKPVHPLIRRVVRNLSNPESVEG